jgi:hypothetical protein
MLRHWLLRSALEVPFHLLLRLAVYEQRCPSAAVTAAAVFVTLCDLADALAAVLSHWAVEWSLPC